MVMTKETIRGFHGLTDMLVSFGDIETPSGPPHPIRPSPEQCMGRTMQAGFASLRLIDFKTDASYHFGVLGRH